MPRLRSHSTHVFGALDGIIRNLADEAASEQLLLDCKRDHLKYTESVTDDEYKARSRFFLSFFLFFYCFSLVSLSLSLSHVHYHYCKPCVGTVNYSCYAYAKINAVLCALHSVRCFDDCRGVPAEGAREPLDAGGSERLHEALRRTRARRRPPPPVTSPTSFTCTCSTCHAWPCHSLEAQSTCTLRIATHSIERYNTVGLTPKTLCCCGIFLLTCKT